MKILRLYNLQNQNKSHPIKLNVLNNGNGSQGNIQLVVDSRMGVILGSVAQAPGKKLFIDKDVKICRVKSCMNHRNHHDNCFDVFHVCSSIYARANIYVYCISLVYGDAFSDRKCMENTCSVSSNRFRISITPY